MFQSPSALLPAGYIQTAQPLLDSKPGWTCDHCFDHELLTLSVLQYQYRERIAFAVSAAILITCLRERPTMVRGVFGRITNSVLN